MVPPHVFVFLFKFFISSQAAAKFDKEFHGVPDPCPEPTIPDLSTLRIPEVYLGNTTTSATTTARTISETKLTLTTTNDTFANKILSAPLLDKALAPAGKTDAIIREEPPQHIQVIAAAATSIVDEDKEPESKIVDVVAPSSDSGGVPSARKKERKKKKIIIQDEGSDDADVAFAWEELDPRIDTKSGSWKG